MHRRQFLKGSALTVAAVALFKHKATDTPLPTDRPIIVAASDSSMESRHAADIRCSGFNDDLKIQRAIDFSNGGTIHMTGGTFDFSNGGIDLSSGGNHIVGNRFIGNTIIST